ncbi:KTSC domain-containing protein [Ensifer aridi]|uniref:KTSC domain-containing protein n=1 Tax=Ensifer aridi TaxID=1708715 RepID=UPI0009BDE41F|nr:KTSC domain-containing protein [Ensifer aridi]
MPILRSSAILDSSAIHEVRYDAPRRTLSIWFMGKRRPYHYLDVPERVYEELLHADSAGNYFNHNIKNHYDFMH